MNVADLDLGLDLAPDNLFVVLKVLKGALVVVLVFLLVVVTWTSQRERLLFLHYLHVDLHPWDVVGDEVAEDEPGRDQEGKAEATLVSQVEDADETHAEDPVETQDAGETGDPGRGGHRGDARQTVEGGDDDG